MHIRIVALFTSKAKFTKILSSGFIVIAIIGTRGNIMIEGKIIYKLYRQNSYLVIN